MQSCVQVTAARVGERTRRCCASTSAQDTPAQKALAAGAGGAPSCQHPPSSQPQAAAQYRFRSSRASICSRWGRRRGARGRRHARWHAIHAHLLAHCLCILTHLPIVVDERQLRTQDLVIPFRALFDLDIGYEPSPICARAHVCVCVCACVYSRTTTFPSPCVFSRMTPFPSLHTVRLLPHEGKVVMREKAHERTTCVFSLMTTFPSLSLSFSLRLAHRTRRARERAAYLARTPGQRPQHAVAEQRRGSVRERVTCS